MCAKKIGKLEFDLPMSKEEKTSLDNLKRKAHKEGRRLQIMFNVFV